MIQKLAHEHESLIIDLLSIAHEAVRKRGRRLDWLRFAKRTLTGYAFFKNTDDQWETLTEIVKEAKVLHPHYEFAVVVDIASELFNQEEEDLNTLHVAF